MKVCENGHHKIVYGEELHHCPYCDIIRSKNLIMKRLELLEAKENTADHLREIIRELKEKLDAQSQVTFRKMYEINRLNNEIFRLKADKEPDKPEEKEPEVDWSKVAPGTLVEMRERRAVHWRVGYFQCMNRDASKPFVVSACKNGTQRTGYALCRLYQPESGWIKHDGSVDCPVPKGKYIVYMKRCLKVQFACVPEQLRWDCTGLSGDILKYLIIDRPSDSAGGS